MHPSAQQFLCQQARALAHAILWLSEGFPPDERHGLTLELRDSALTLPEVVAWAVESGATRQRDDALLACAERLRERLRVGCELGLIDTSEHAGIELRLAELTHTLQASRPLAAAGPELLRACP